MIKILFNEKRIMLAESYSTLQNEINPDNALILFECSKEKVLHSLDLLMISEVQLVVFVGNEQEMMSTIKNSFTNIIAGGGIVGNSKDEFLFIYRRGKWDLPKGKTEEGEQIEECAVREVMEETGLSNVALDRYLCTTFHLYYDQEFIFKETYWYTMNSEDRVLRPQLEEGIQKAVWVHKTGMNMKLRNTYDSIRDIFAMMS